MESRQYKKFCNRNFALPGYILLVFVFIGLSSCSLVQRRYSRGFFLYMSALGARRLKQETGACRKQKDVKLPVITKIIADLKMRQEIDDNGAAAICIQNLIATATAGKKITVKKETGVFSAVKESAAFSPVGKKGRNNFLNSSAKIVATASNNDAGWYKLAFLGIALYLLWDFFAARFFRE